MLTNFVVGKVTIVWIVLQNDYYNLTSYTIDCNIYARIILTLCDQMRYFIPGGIIEFPITLVTDTHVYTDM